jgi:hypothetical protein
MYQAKEHEEEFLKKCRVLAVKRLALMVNPTTPRNDLLQDWWDKDAIQAVVDFCIADDLVRYK